MNRRMGQGALGFALALGMFFVGPEAAEAGGRGDYWDPRASIPARIIDTHLGIVGLAATIAGDYRTAAVVDHISGRFPAPAPVAVVEHVYYPPPVVQQVYYAPAPVVVQHIHAAGCGHGGYGYGYGGGYGGGRGHGHGRHRGWRHH